MKHKWHKEIKAWADGAEIEYSGIGHAALGWVDCKQPIDWDSDRIEYRIKPQPKEPKYLYVYEREDTFALTIGKEFNGKKMQSVQHDYFYVGKIKLEQNDE